MVPAMVAVRLGAPRLRPVVEVVCTLPLVVPPIAFVAGISTVLRWGPDHLAAHPAVPDLRRDPEPGLPRRPGPRLRRAGAAVRLPGAGRRAARRSTCRTLVEAARNCGPAGRRRSSGCVLPNLRGALLNASFLTLALVLGEFTVARCSASSPSPSGSSRSRGSQAQLSVAVSVLSLLSPGCCCSSSPASAAAPATTSRG